VRKKPGFFQIAPISEDLGPEGVFAALAEANMNAPRTAEELRAGVWFSGILYLFLNNFYERARLTDALRGLE
jgi:hypothetical protein